MRHPDTDDPSWLHGQLVDSPEVVRYLAAVDDGEPADDVDGYTFWTSSSAGLSLEVGCTRRISHVVIYAGRGGGSRYAHPLPYGLDVDLTRAEIVARLGAPALTGPAHDTWQWGAACFSVLYDEDERVRQLSVLDA